MAEIMESFLFLRVIVVLFLVAVRSCRADISNDNPTVGTCVCLDATAVNVRATACGTVVGQANTGDCYTYLGTKTACTLSGILYQFFETDYGSTSGWIAGDYLIYGTGCGGGGSPTEPDSEFRSVFMATAWNVDWPTSSADSVAAQQQQLRTYLDVMTNTNMNAIVFQVRPAGDAMYISSIEPWSRYLTGTQGQAPNPLWDPLDYLISNAHSRGIEVHAWLNPYRANLAPNWDGLAANHMANVYREHAHPYSSYLWMDPGADVVVNHLRSVITDIINRYDVDGIHFDDYFYPYPDANDFPDDSTYNAYVNSGGGMSRENWRRDNVNRMVQSVYNLIKSTKPAVRFSISPFGIYRPGHPEGMPSPPIAGMDPYTDLYADAKYWLQQGWVDFFAPQLYWEIDPPQQSYPTLLDWWLNNNPAGRHIYAATGVYKIVDNSWPVSEIVNQIDISRDTGRRALFSLGNVHYSAKFFRDNTKGITDTFQSSVYTKPVTIPAMTWLALNAPHPPERVFVVPGSTVIRWSAVEEESFRWWVVLRKEGSKWEVVQVLPDSVTSLDVIKPGTYSVRGANRAWQQSDDAIVHVLQARGLA